ncbi:hypothetical protein JHN55_11820 [Streptomyces sp. MBT56]|uniref:hypothetical protein n=1 Tax=unclassified Streptomyces TaxID=2593676 RepID=UPI0019099333|nr:MULTISPECIES: hypothetical protein [unclassified Streptomyces]MBK3557204.1 hypothetical protein [Streptomyces sp. MBT56]MBK3600365.1 hypothetical protein [Streptomyces sp. MBT54]MBK3617878.1 hypothetical protein [Streptomyces sp. MBT98]
MTGPDTEWQLLNNGTLVGTITVDDAGMPWQRGRFLPAPAFSQFRPWLDELNTILEVDEFERFDEAYDRIEGALTLVSSTGPVVDFFLHIDQNRACFRWDSEPPTG